MKYCPICNSTKLVYFRLDSDWASGAGNWSAVNDESQYEEWQRKHLEDNERQDIETFYCYDCGECFNKPIAEFRKQGEMR